MPFLINPITGEEDTNPFIKFHSDTPLDCEESLEPNINPDLPTEKQYAQSDYITNVKPTKLESICNASLKMNEFPKHLPISSDGYVKIMRNNPLDLVCLSLFL